MKTTIKTTHQRAGAAVRILAFVLCAGIWALSFAAPVQAQGATQRIQTIRVEGAQRIDPQTVLTYIDIQPGDYFESGRLNRAIKSLFSTGLFADVSLYQEKSDLVIVVSENPIINEIRFEGNEEVKTELLEPEVQLRSRNVLTRTRLQADVERLQDVYRYSGRFAARIEPKIIKLDQNRVNLVFEIDEGPETLITRLAFLGNKRFDESQLTKVVRSQEDRWWRFWSNHNRYDPDRLEYDKELLRRFYLESGYADFVVESAIAELSPDRQNFYVTYSLSEGERYKVGSISINSNIAGLSGDVLRKQAVTKPGEWYRASHVEKTVMNITNELGNMQYAFVEVVPDVQRNRDTHTVDLVFTINPGRRIFIERINVSGNQRTLDEVIRREMLLVEGDPFNAEKLNESEKRLNDLGFFEKVEVTPQQGTTADKANIDIAVAEKSTGSMSIGAGFSTTDGPLGDFRITERNFLGKGQVLGFATTVAGERSQFQLSFTEPYFLKRDLNAGFDLFHISRDYQDESSYDTRQSGIGLRMGYPLSDKWRQSLGYRFEQTDVRNVPASASKYIKDQEGKYTTSSISQRLVYDSTNSREEPTEGLIARISTEASGLGGDSRYLQLRAGGTYYYPVRDKWVLSVLAEAGHVLGYGGKDVRITERFYIGGDSLRGFESAGIGPRDLATNDALGGNTFWRGSVQVDFPSGLPEDLGVRLHVFTDLGALWNLDSSGATVIDENVLRASAGVGVAWDSPMGPVTVSYALPYAKADYDETEYLRFAFGTRF